MEDDAGDVETPATRILALALFAGLGSACQAPPQAVAEEAAAVPVRVQEIRTRHWSEPIGGYGVVEAESATTLSVGFPGRVEEVSFEEGQRVEVGETLIRFETDKRSLRVKQSQAAVDAAKAALDNARAELTRLRGLKGSGASTASALDNAESVHRQAAAGYQDALAARGLARRELSDGLLKSPVSGIVERRAVEAGEMVAPGQPLGVIQAVDALEVLSHVTEKDVNSLRVGDAATVTASAVRGRTYEARITSLGIAADPRTGNFSVRLLVDAEGNGDGLLRPGMTTRVELHAQGVPDAIIVPEDAVVDRDRRRVIFVAVDGRAVQVLPVVGLTSSDAVQIVHGLAVGDQLIVSGLGPVVDGTQIEVVEVLEGEEPEQ